MKSVLLILSLCFVTSTFARGDDDDEQRRKNFTDSEILERETDGDDSQLSDAQRKQIIRDYKDRHSGNVDCVFSRKLDRCLNKDEKEKLNERYSTKISDSATCEECCPIGNVFNKDSRVCISEFENEYYLYLLRGDVVTKDEYNELTYKLAAWSELGVLPSPLQMGSPENSKKYQLSGLNDNEACFDEQLIHELQIDGKITKRTNHLEYNKTIWLLKNAQFVSRSDKSEHKACPDSKVAVRTSKVLPPNYQGACVACSQGDNLSNTVMQINDHIRLQQAQEAYKKHLDLIKENEDKDVASIQSFKENYVSTFAKRNSYCMDKEIAQFVILSGDIEEKTYIPPVNCGFNHRRSNGTSDESETNRESEGNTNGNIDQR